MKDLINASTEEAKKMAFTIVTSQETFPPEMCQPFVMNLFFAVEQKIRLEIQSSVATDNTLPNKVNVQVLDFLMGALNDVTNRFGFENSAKFEKYLGQVISSDSRLKDALIELLTKYNDKQNFFNAIKDADKLNQLKKLSGH